MSNIWPWLRRSTWDPHRGAHAVTELWNSLHSVVVSTLHTHFDRAVPQASRINNVLLSTCRDSHFGWPFPHRGLQKDYRTNRVFGTDVKCWFVHNSGKGFIDGHYKDYLVPPPVQLFEGTLNAQALNQFIIENSSLLLHTQTGSCQPTKPDWPKVTSPPFPS